MLLAASLLLNLFLIALVAGHLVQRRLDEAGAAKSPLARALARAEASLPASDARAFGTVIRRDEPLYAGSARQLAQARRALARAIVAEPFDAQAARQALTAWQASWNHFLDDFRDPLIEALAQVSPRGRRRLVAERRRRAGPLTP